MSVMRKILSLGCLAARGRTVLARSGVGRSLQIAVTSLTSEGLGSGWSPVRSLAVSRRQYSESSGAPEIQIQRLQGEKSGFKKDPVIILLGWSGSQDKHLEKYSNIYKNQGYIALRYTAPWRQIFFSGIFSKNLHYTARKLLDLLFDIGIEDHPILFHVFSNGGCMLYRHIVELQCNKTETYFTKLNVIGTIFDSAPGNMNLQGGIRALYAVLGSSTNVFVKCIVISAFVFIAVLKVMVYPVTQFVCLSCYDALKVNPSRWPQLYLYSKADKIISYKEVEAMIKVRKQLDIHVQSVDFNTSQHVNHFREYPDEYSTKCISFLKECVQQTPLSRLFDKKKI